MNNTNLAYTIPNDYPERAGLMPDMPRDKVRHICIPVGRHGSFEHQFPGGERGTIYYHPAKDGIALSYYGGDSDIGEMVYIQLRRPKPRRNWWATIKWLISGCTMCLMLYVLVVGLSAIGG